MLHLHLDINNSLKPNGVLKHICSILAISFHLFQTILTAIHWFISVFRISLFAVVKWCWHCTYRTIDQRSTSVYSELQSSYAPAKTFLFLAARFLINALLVLEMCSAFLLNDEYDVWLTTGDQSKKLSREASIGTSPHSQGYSVWVDRNKRRQTIEGFGAALTNSAAYNIYHSRRRQDIMRDLFGSNGIGIVDFNP